LSTEDKINLVENKENNIYLELIRIAIWENTDSSSLEKAPEFYKMAAIFTALRCERLEITLLVRIINLC
jgi:hypothetical protein